MSKDMAIPLPSQVVHNLPKTKTTVEMIRVAIQNIVVDDDEAARELIALAYNPDSAGNRQMGQALVAERLFKYVDPDGKPAIFSSYDFLNHKELWHHFVIVMAHLGYEISGGKLVRHRLADDSQRSEEEAA